MADHNPAALKSARSEAAAAKPAAAKPAAQPKPPAPEAAPGANATAQPERRMNEKGPASAVVPDAASGAASSSESQLTSPWSLTSLLEMDSMQSQTDFIRAWSQDVKTRVDAALLTYLKEHKDSFHFQPPADVMSIPALAISEAASGATLTSFREIMNYDNLQSSFRRTGQYEAAGTLWMLDPCGDSVSDESVTIAQIEAARWQWSEEVFIQSSGNPDMRRFSFDVPLPARMQKPEMALREAVGSKGVIMLRPLPMIAGKAHVLAWYSAVSDAFQERSPNHQRIKRLFEAALSVPIRLRLCPDNDACALASLQYAEAAGMYAAASGADSFWLFAERLGRLRDIQDAIKDNISAPKLLSQLKALGVTFKGKSMTDAHAKAVKSLLPYATDTGCKGAYLRAEVMCPEAKDQTLLMRLAVLCSRRGTDAASGAVASMIFLLDTMRAARLTGEFPKGEGITVANIIGADKKKAAWADIQFKKQDLIAFLMHEAELLDTTMLAAVQKFRTPAAILKHYSATGEDGMVGRFLQAAPGAAGRTLNECFAVQVAEYRDRHGGGPKVQQLLDLMWGTWSGAFEEELQNLATQECVAASHTFLWHRHLSDSDSSAELGSKYRSFLAACAVGPVALDPGNDDEKMAAGLGASELGESDQQEIKKAQEQLMTLRRSSVNFLPLQAVGGASGADYSQAQLNKTWEKMRLGHKFSKKKGDRRALVFSADLFPPNLTKHGRSGGLIDQVQVDLERMKRTIAFMLQKRTKDDVVMLFDGRSRHCRKVMEMFEEDLAASGACALTEVWFVFVTPPKNKDPRAPGRSVSFGANNKEAALVSYPAGKSKEKVVHRCEFNTCGEVSTTSTTYTGIQMRRLSELPRMSADMKGNILGAAASGAVEGKRLQADIDEKGHPFSWAETKPLPLLQRVCEHHKVTHIADFTPGSAALAIAASGAMQYEGIAASEEHQKWMDSILDRCIMYLVGNDEKVCEKLGGDAEFTAKVTKFFAGSMQEVRRYLQPLDDDDEEDDNDSSATGEDA